MGFINRFRARSMGISPRMQQVIERLHPHFTNNSFLKGNPDASMRILATFAAEHGKDSEQLTDNEVNDFINLLQGIHFLTHPDTMALYRKYGCDACQLVYVELLWKLATRPILEHMRSEQATPTWDDLAPEEQRKIIGDITGQQEFLES